MPAAYPPEFRRRAVELVEASDKPLAHVAKELGVSDAGLRKWVKQAEIDSGTKPGLTKDEKAELVRLRRELRTTKMENEILKRAAAYFATENVLPK